MDLYKRYFESGLYEQAYGSEWEAVGDIRALVDLCLALVFYGRDAAAERLDMRGVVITPQEFELALTDWTLESRYPSQERMEQYNAIRVQISQAGRHVEGRMAQSRAEGCLPRVFQITDELELNSLEVFCFWLALVLDYDRKYERIYGYLQDNVGARLPTLGLGISLYQKCVDVDGRKMDQAGRGYGLWIGEESRLWRYLLKDIPPEVGESKLSRPLCVREPVIGYLRGEHKREGGWKPDREMAPGAVRVHLVYGWEDLITEETQRMLLHQICDRVRYRDQVMDEWGFGEKSPYGNGVSAVFYGAPGTGKTMAAQVIGKELGLEVCKVDLSQMVSKYIGETEKNMKNLFESAAEQNLILFFDEADSLFAKRSEVTSSNDRYANMETGYLLQQFEAFGGVSILATNFINNIDEAFRRRIKFYVRFPFPDREMRLKLWTSMIPTRAGIEEPLRLAEYAGRFELPGSDIKEVITNAAFIAAAAGRGIRNEDVEKALRIHYLKLGKKIGEQGFGRL